MTSETQIGPAARRVRSDHNTNQSGRSGSTNQGNEGRPATCQVTKKDAILAVLRIRSLNRFEAEQHGDHCLHSTISELRNDGHRFHDEWELVPNRFGGETRVKRYYLVRGA